MPSPKRLTPTTAAALAVVILGFALRLYRLGVPSLWLDELGQASVASLGLSSAIAGARLHQGAAPFDYILTWIALQVAHNDFVVRMTAALWGTLTLALVFQLGKQVFGASTGLLAALLMAVAPLAVRYSQEARFYALFACLTVASTLALMAALHRNSLRSWVIYTALLVVSLYSHYYTVLLVLVQGISVIMVALWPNAFPAPLESRGNGVSATPEVANSPPPVHWRVRVRIVAPFVLSCLVSALAFTPWFLTTVLQETGLPWAQPPALTWPFMGTLGTWLVLGGEKPPPDLALLAIFGGLTLVGIIGGVARPRSRFGTLLALLTVGLVPPLLVLGLQWSHYFFAIRQALFVLPFLLLLTSAGVTELVRKAVQLPWVHHRRRLGGTVLSIILVGVLLYPLLAYTTTGYETSRQNWRDALMLVEDNAAPEDGIIIPGLDKSYFHYYSSGLSDRIVVVGSLQHAQRVAARHSANWVVMTGQTARTGTDIHGWVDRTAAVSMDVGDILVYYLAPNDSLSQVSNRIARWELPPNAGAWEGVAHTYARTGRVRSASAALERAAAVAGGRRKASNLWVQQGILWQEAGEQDQAIAGYHRALDVWPKNIEALRSLGTFLLTHGQPAAAEAYLETAKQAAADQERAASSARKAYSWETLVSGTRALFRLNASK